MTEWLNLFYFLQPPIVNGLCYTCIFILSFQEYFLSEVLVEYKW